MSYSRGACAASQDVVAALAPSSECSPGLVPSGEEDRGWVTLRGCLENRVAGFTKSEQPGVKRQRPTSSPYFEAEFQNISF